MISSELSTIEITLRGIAELMSLYFSEPMGADYWNGCDQAGDRLEAVVNKSFIASCTNFKISQISWASIHVEQNWAAFFSSAVCHLPLEGH